MSPVPDLRAAARDVFGWEELTDAQVTAMTAVMDGHDVVAVLPTGAGKSAIYQVPAVLIDGPTVVVSPLIALQHDQLAGLRGSGAPRAVAINSSRSAQENERAWRAIADAAVEYVFLSPEQLANDDVMAAVRAAKPSLLVVDEAHCVSAWGHDFRPDYLRLGHVVEQLGRPTVIALTATAAPPTRRDLAERLRLREPVEVVASFDRPNLRLGVQWFASDDDKRRGVADRVAELAAGCHGSGLVYVATRKDTADHVERLRAAGVDAVGYHAGMRRDERDDVHRRFLAGDVRVVVATSAFGMGIDKPDVRFVCHASVPSSPDAYYQEIGRAGRDGEPAEVWLAYRPEDLALQRFLTATSVRADDVARVLHVALRAAQAGNGPLSATRLGQDADVPAARRTRAINLLERAGALVTTTRGRLRVPAGVDADEAVATAVELAEARQRLVRSQVDMMRGYAETTGCRRAFLLGHFGEQLPGPCGHCDTCESGLAAASRSGGSDDAGVDAGPFPVDTRVRHELWGDGVVLRVEDGTLTVLFETEGYRTLSRDVVQENDLLTVVG